MTTEADIAVIGGSFAGAAAALYIARGRRQVAIFDTGITRNLCRRKSRLSRARRRGP